MNETSTDSFCKNYSLESILNKPRCYKNPKSPLSFDLILNNQKETFLRAKSKEAWLSDFGKTVVSVFFF